MAPCDEPSALEGQEPSHRSDADEDLSMSPAKSKPPQQRNVEPPNRGNYHNKQNARDEALRRELESVRQVNKAIETAIGSLAKARNSMETVSTTVSSASWLLSIWTKILSQTEHNQRLMLNPSWKGATQDLEDTRQENLIKQQAAQRKEYEEKERRAVAARKAEDDERRRAETATRVARGMSRGRGVGRAGAINPISTTSYVGVGGGQGGRRTTRGISTARRSTIGVRKGITSVRGTGKG